jgi:hypothetical protein
MFRSELESDGEAEAIYMFRSELERDGEAEAIYIFLEVN